MQVDSAKTRSQALQKLKRYASEPFARAERRASGWQIRVGAWHGRGEAQRELPHLRAAGAREARVLAMETNVAWLLPDGSTLGGPVFAAKPAPAAPAPAAEAPVQAAAPAPAAALMTPAPAPRVEPLIELTDAFRKSAALLDSEVRRWLRDNGATRRDRGTYGMDVAPLMLYAAQRGDSALYQALVPAAQRLVLDARENGPYTDGFVLWRRMPGAKPEVSGATEALWLARALRAGSKAFSRPEDRSLSLHILDGYAKHAFELQGFWLVRKYFAFEAGTFVNLSSVVNYHGDFLDEVLREDAPASLRGLPERSYAMIERTRNAIGLLNPVIQPEIGATYVNMGVETFAPNGLVPLEDSCLGAEGALRGVPQAARDVLSFGTAGKRRDHFGRVRAYFDARDGASLGDPELSGVGYACLARVAVALKDSGALKDLAEPLRVQMQLLGEAPQVLESPLYTAGPMLLAAYAMGAFSP